MSISATIGTSELDATENTYSLVKKEGYESLRRELSKESDLNWKLEIKNTIDLNSPDKPNRHLVSVSRGVEDAITGEIQTVTVHAVITRHKNVTDAVCVDVAYELASVLTTANFVDNVLQGDS